MGHLLGRGFFLATILMFGFILGILYSNHISDAPGKHQENNGPGSGILASLSNRQPYQGYILKETEDYKIEIEDGESTVIYEHDDESIRENLIQREDLKRDLTGKQQQADEDAGYNFFSDMGLRTADALEGTFRKLFSFVDD
ncbi:hypothetical protein MM300_15720 [Evansella sp. LMS18]|uniref:hypothetical protein n=1 Tax=Evansella sp. LMS18 TaxID=2924033 RepID=UPI0020D00726|nr:hypothetical protein [Evansella sp. LMS18]UTR09338.1 hypothetical protein MM300_15720 [Evansella sp. LMS18]